MLPLPCNMLDLVNDVLSVLLIWKSRHGTYNVMCYLWQTVDAHCMRGLGIRYFRYQLQDVCKGQIQRDGWSPQVPHACMGKRIRGTASYTTSPNLTCIPPVYWLLVTLTLTTTHY